MEKWQFLHTITVQLKTIRNIIKQFAKIKAKNPGKKLKKIMKTGETLLDFVRL